MTWAYLDGCPECTVRDNTPTSTVVTDDRLHVTAEYVCRCGMTWVTRWLREPDDGLDEQRSAA